MFRAYCALALIVALAVIEPATASPLSSATRARLAAGKTTWVIVEIDGTAADRTAGNERTRRGLRRDDAAILNLRTQGYRTIKSRVESAASSADAVQAIDYHHFPLSAWRLSSLAALNRLQAHPSVLMVHENFLLHPVSVSDLSFIDQPQTAAAGATGAGTTVAVIDGGLGTNYLNFSDFGTCTGVNMPPATCRVVINQDFYPGGSAVTVHGTNVSAIALGVAPGTKLAMYNVFNGANASSADVLTAMNSAIGAHATYNIVAINMSLGDGTSHATQCQTSVFKTAVNNAKNVGILTVVAAGNNGSKSGLAEPACTPGVVSVGAVYDASYGNVTWSGGLCTDASAADKVTCFSQSASYLTILAPGTFVNAPSGAFQQSGTSQATPHVAGAIAVLRALYPADSLDQTLQRLTSTGIQDTDPGNGLTFPRLSLYAAAGITPAASSSGDAPLPLWMLVLLGLGLLTIIEAVKRSEDRRCT